MKENYLELSSEVKSALQNNLPILLIHHSSEMLQMSLRIAATPLTTARTSHFAKGKVKKEFASFHLIWYRRSICIALKVSTSWILVCTEFRSNHDPISASCCLMVILFLTFWSPDDLFSGYVEIATSKVPWFVFFQSKLLIFNFINLEKCGVYVVTSSRLFLCEQDNSESNRTNWWNFRVWPIITLKRTH